MNGTENIVKQYCCAYIFCDMENKIISADIGLFRDVTGDKQVS